MKEKIIEMNDEQPQLINEQVKRAINIIFQRLKTRIQPKKQYTGEEFLSRSLEIIKKATLKILSNDDDDDDEQSEDNIPSEDENQKNDEPLNGNSVDQNTLNEAISTIPTEEKNSLESETLSTNNQKNGWDTVDDFQQESTIQSTESSEQNQIVLVTEDSTSTGIQIEATSSSSLIENNQSIPSSKNIEEEHDSDGTADTMEENDEKPPPPPEVEIPKEKIPSDDGK
jgi:hypothetical protein